MISPCQNVTKNESEAIKLGIVPQKKKKSWREFTETGTARTGGRARAVSKWEKAAILPPLVSVMLCSGRTRTLHESWDEVNINAVQCSTPSLLAAESLWIADWKSLPRDTDSKEKFTYLGSWPLPDPLNNKWNLKCGGPLKTDHTIKDNLNQLLQNDQAYNLIACVCDYIIIKY